VSVERDEAAHQVRAFAKSGQRRRVDFVAALLQKIGDSAIAPAAGRGAVDEHEGLSIGRSGHAYSVGTMKRNIEE
jgi:hypothetical protein